MKAYFSLRMTCNSNGSCRGWGHLRPSVALPKATKGWGAAGNGEFFGEWTVQLEKGFIGSIVVMQLFDRCYVPPL